jgi:hypothetical protein
MEEVGVTVTIKSGSIKTNKIQEWRNWFVETIEEA